jgi:hypothetical protein
LNSLVNVFKQRTHIKSTTKFTSKRAAIQVTIFLSCTVASISLNAFIFELVNLSPIGRKFLNSKTVFSSISATGIKNLEAAMSLTPFSLQQEKEHY